MLYKRRRFYIYADNNICDDLINFDPSWKRYICVPLLLRYRTQILFIILHGGQAYLSCMYLYTHCMMDLIYIHVKHVSKAYRVYPVYIGDLMFSCRIRSIIEYVLYRHGNVCIFIYKNKYIDLLSLECETFIDYLTSPLTGCDTMYCSIYTLSNLLTSLLTSLKKRCHIILCLCLCFVLLYIRCKLFCKTNASITYILMVETHASIIGYKKLYGAQL